MPAIIRYWKRIRCVWSSMPVQSLMKMRIYAEPPLIAPILSRGWLINYHLIRDSYSTYILVIQVFCLLHKQCDTTGDESKKFDELGDCITHLQEILFGIELTLLSLCHVTCSLYHNKWLLTWIWRNAFDLPFQHCVLMIKTFQHLRFITLSIFVLIEKMTR